MNTLDCIYFQNDLSKQFKGHNKNNGKLDAVFSENLPEPQQPSVELFKALENSRAKCNIILINNNKIFIEAILKKWQFHSSVYFISNNKTLYDTLLGNREKYRSNKADSVSESESIIKFIFLPSYFLFNDLVQLIKCLSFNVFISQEMLHYKNEAIKLHQYLLSCINRKKINIETAKKFSSKWITHIIKNRKAYINNPGISFFQDFCLNKPIAIIGGGPSLNETVSILKQYKNNCIIICVDTAFRVLIKAQIIPDFIVSFDAQSFNATYILNQQKSLKPEDLPVCISPPTVSPLLVQKYKGGMGFTSVFFEPVQKLDQLKTLPSVELLSGGTVTSSAYDFARFMGGCPILFFGLDLCYSHDKLHADHSLYEDLFYYWQNYSNSYLTLVTKIMEQSYPYITKDFKNRRVRTDVKFEMFAHWFSGYIMNESYFVSDRTCSFPDFRVADKNKTNEILEKSDCRDLKQKIGILKKKYYLPDKNDRPSYYDQEKYDVYYSILIRELEALKILLDNAGLLSKKVSEYQTKNLSVSSLIHQLNILDEKIKTYQEGIELLSFMTQRDIFNIEYSEKSVVEESSDFYYSLAKNCDKLLYILKN